MLLILGVVADTRNYRMQKIDAELIRLRAENSMLKTLLAQNGIAIPQQVAAETAVAVPRASANLLSPDAKVKLFRRLFQGRNDVYPIRWQSPNTGKSGYSPVCANEWRNGVCDKPRIKCGDCSHSLYVPVTDNVIYRHLKGDI